MKIRKLSFFLSAVIYSSLLVPIEVHAVINLTFGIYATDRASTMFKKFKPVLNELEVNLAKETGETVKIKLVISKSYDQGVAMLQNGEIDFARFGPASYVNAKTNVPGISVLAIESKKGKKTFQGIICVKVDSKIQEISELKGRSFAFGDKNSTIGRYLSQQQLVKASVLASDLSEYKYLGRHDTVGLAVASGKFDAGALKESTFKEMKESGKSIRSILSFTNVTKPWISSSQLSTKLRTALSAALLATKIKKFNFVEGDDSDYDTIRRAIQQNDQFFN